MRLFVRLRMKLTEKGISQSAAGKAAGLSAATMTGRMTGKQPFTAWEMQKIGRLLDIPAKEYTAYFFDWEQLQQPENENRPGRDSVQSGGQ